MIIMQWQHRYFVAYSPAHNIDNDRSALVTVVPTLPYSTYSQLPDITMSKTYAGTCVYIAAFQQMPPPPRPPSSADWLANWFFLHRPFEDEISVLLHKYPFRSSQRTHCVFIRKNKWLSLYRQILLFIVRTARNTRIVYVGKNYELFTLKLCGVYICTSL